MIIYNISDKSSGVLPQNVKVRGKVITPGESIEGDHRDAALLAGLEKARLVSIGTLPVWYTAAAKAELRREAEGETATKSDAAEKKTRRRREKLS